MCLSFSEFQQAVSLKKIKFEDCNFSEVFNFVFSSLLHFLFPLLFPSGDASTDLHKQNVRDELNLEDL